MADQFVRLDDQIRSEMLVMVRLLEEIIDQERYIVELSWMKWEAEFEKAAVERRAEFSRVQEKLCKEGIADVNEELKLIDEMLLGRENLMVVASQCGDGFLCANINDVIAFAEMVKLTGHTEKAVIVERASPNYGRMVKFAANLGLVIKEI